MPKTFLFICSLLVLVIVMTRCMDDSHPVARRDMRGKEYIGSKACRPCHENIHRSYDATAHRHTSAPPSKQSIRGRFDDGHNSYAYRPNVYVRMEQRDSGYYQVAYLNNSAKQAFPFGTVIGSGRKAQTFLYWYGDNAFQLPVSYSVREENWVNSPGYPPDKVRFDRLVNVGCFECHASYIKWKGTQQEGTRMVDYFDRHQIIYGIDCERCHGPAAQHVFFHEKNPQEKKPHHIARYASLSRQARLDLCAQCHSGAHTERKSIFDFKPGDSLSAYFLQGPNDAASVSELDVHGNQYQLLAASACFVKSTTLDCASCHNPHQHERNNMEVFSQRCMQCHQPTNDHFCPMSATLGKEITRHCIDCHMPAAPSKVIAMKAAEAADASPNLVRTHYITVYPEVAAAYIDSLKKMKHLF